MERREERVLTLTGDPPARKPAPYWAQYLSQGIVIGSVVFVVDRFLLGSSWFQATWVAVVAGLLVPLLGRVRGKRG
ncbi:MAG: hypothetical protein HY720_21790 [Planctomycetes bacterium]|nr:hypothetical protein [Planctomycetota bacterium]